MLGHYLTVALRTLRRAPITAAINVIALALGLAAFVTAYGVVNFWDKSERHFANVDRIYGVTANLEARNGSLKTGVSPTTNRLYADYLKAEFPDFEAVARASGVPSSASPGERCDLHTSGSTCGPRAGRACSASTWCSCSSAACTRCRRA